MVPLLITAHTPHGVVFSRPWGVAFDGLLASVVWHRRKRDAAESGRPLTYQPENPEPDVLDLPLARCPDPTGAGNWHWLATFAETHPRHHDTPPDPDIRWRTSRTDRHRLQHLAPTIGSQVVTDNAGRYQFRIIPVMAQPATTVTWRAVGDPDGIRDLLAEVESIGKHRGVGEGLVTGWDITETPDVDEWSAGHEHQPGILGRTIPLRCAPAHATPRPVATAAIRPPYLHPASRTDSYAPDH